MSELGINHIDRFVFEPRYQPELPVLILSEDQSSSILSAFFRRFSPSKTVVQDSKVLTDLHTEIHRRIKYEMPARRLGKYMGAILNAGTVTETGFSFSLGGLLNHQNPSANNITLSKTLIIYEDAIPEKQLSEFFGLFKHIDPQQRPAIIFISEASMSSAAKKVAACGSHVAVSVLTPSGVAVSNAAATPAREMAEYLQFFLAEADGAGLATDPSVLSGEASLGGEFERIAFEMIHIQMLFRAGRKFEPRNRVIDLKKRVESLWSDQAETRTKQELLGIKALLNIWEVFLFEGRGDIVENTISIANSIGDDILLAHALKQVPLLHGYGEPISSATHESEKSFPLWS